MEEYFIESDNVIDKAIDQFLEKHNYSKQRKLAKLKSDIVTVFAMFFTNNNKDEARYMLNGEESKVPRKPLCFIAFFGGGIIISSIVMIMFSFNHKQLHADYGQIFDETKEEDYEDTLRDKSYKMIWENMEGKAPIFKFTFAIIYILFGAGVCVNVYRKYEINYFHIF